MSNFLKHVGKHGDRKVVILFKEVPNEDHMCLVIYPDVLPAPWEDAIMRALTSDMGQQADEFANALHRTLLPDGRVVLETLHMEKMIKKIRTADVIVTPRSDSSIRLDELNKMLREMKTGEEAIKRMAENDAARGLVDAPTKRAAEQAYKEGRQQSVARAQAPQDGALDDRAIAGNMLAQATRMEAEAKGLIAEAARMKKEAERMDPTVTASKIPTQQPAKRGRPSKATKAVADAAQ
jgi:hypothetical protein